MLSLLLLLIAAEMDIRTSRVSNRLICCGLFAGLLFQVQESGIGGIGFFLRNISIPVILLYLLFLVRVLGAGDIKLFSVIGSIWNLKVMGFCIGVSFIVAAGMSLYKLICNQNLNSRLNIFFSYLYELSKTGQLKKYPRESDGKQNVIHFSIAVLIGFIITMEVVY